MAITSTPFNAHDHPPIAVFADVEIPAATTAPHPFAPEARQAYLKTANSRQAPLSAITVTNLPLEILTEIVQIYQSHCGLLASEQKYVHSGSSGYRQTVYEHVVTINEYGQKVIIPNVEVTYAYDAVRDAEGYLTGYLPKWRYYGLASIASTCRTWANAVRTVRFPSVNLDTRRALAKYVDLVAPILEEDEKPSVFHPLSMLKKLDFGFHAILSQEQERQLDLDRLFDQFVMDRANTLLNRLTLNEHAVRYLATLNDEQLQQFRTISIQDVIVSFQETQEKIDTLPAVNIDPFFRFLDNLKSVTRLSFKNLTMICQVAPQDVGRRRPLIKSVEEVCFYRCHWYRQIKDPYDVGDRMRKVFPRVRRIAFDGIGDQELKMFEFIQSYKDSLRGLALGWSVPGKKSHLKSRLIASTMSPCSALTTVILDSAWSHMPDYTDFTHLSRYISRLEIYECDRAAYDGVYRLLADRRLQQLDYLILQTKAGEYDKSEGTINRIAVQFTYFKNRNESDRDKWTAAHICVDGFWYGCPEWPLLRKDYE